MAVLNSLLFSYTFYFRLGELFRPLLAFRQTSSRFWLWQNKEGQNGKGAIIFQGMYVHVSSANRRHFGSMLSEKWPLYSKNTPAPSANLPEFVLIQFAATRNQCTPKCFVLRALSIYVLAMKIDSYKFALFFNKNESFFIQKIIFYSKNNHKTENRSPVLWTKYEIVVSITWIRVIWFPMLNYIFI